MGVRKCKYSGCHLRPIRWPIPGIDPGIPQHYAPAPKHDFAPRLSIAWQVRSKLVVRAGYGLYYNSGASQISNLLGGALYGGVPGGFVGSEIDNSTPQDASLSQVFQPSPQVALGTYPVSTGLGQGHYGDGAFQTVMYADKKSFGTPYIHRYQRLCLVLAKSMPPSNKESSS